MTLKQNLYFYHDFIHVVPLPCLGTCYVFPLFLKKFCKIPNAWTKRKCSFDPWATDLDFWYESQCNPSWAQWWTILYGCPGKVGTWYELSSGTLGKEVRVVHSKGTALFRSPRLASSWYALWDFFIWFVSIQWWSIIQASVQQCCLFRLTDLQFHCFLCRTVKFLLFMCFKTASIAFCSVSAFWEAFSIRINIL